MNASVAQRPLTGYQAHRFGGEAAHLDVDFDESGPSLITAILRSTLRDQQGLAPPPEQLWQASVGERLAALIQITRITRGDMLSWQQRCRNTACRSPMEIDIDLAGIAMANSEPAFPITATSECGPLQLRLPTGGDQLRWQQLSAADTGALQTSMARDLVLTLDGVAPAEDWPVPENCFLAIEKRLEDIDPLTALTLVASCPECGEQQALECDLEPLLLAELQGEQCRLFDDVDRLASAYHWSEGDILAMPSQRRKRYLERLDMEIWQ